LALVARGRRKVPKRRLPTALNLVHQDRLPRGEQEQALVIRSDALEPRDCRMSVRGPPEKAGSGARFLAARG
jgi:hypothetical protein